MILQFASKECYLWNKVKSTLHGNIHLFFGWFSHQPQQVNFFICLVFLTFFLIKFPQNNMTCLKNKKNDYLKINCIKRYAWCEPQYNMHDVPIVCFAMWINALQGMLLMFWRVKQCVWDVDVILFIWNCQGVFLVFYSTISLLCCAITQMGASACIRVQHELE